MVVSSAVETCTALTSTGESASRTKISRPVWGRSEGRKSSRCVEWNVMRGVRFGLRRRLRGSRLCGGSGIRRLFSFSIIIV